LTPILQLENICKTYPMGKETLQVLKNVSFSVEPGSFVAIVGPSGCGKSTLLHLIGGLERPSGGSIRFCGREIAGFSEKQLDRYRLENIGMIFQQFYLIPHLSAAGNVEMPLALAGVGPIERKRRADELLKLVGLEDRKHHRPNQLSGGQKQRVAIARALALNPTLLLADEPTGSLDSKTGQTILELLKNIAREHGTTILMVTHSPEIAAQADHVISMLDGEVVGETRRTAGRAAVAASGLEAASVDASGVSSAGSFDYRNDRQKKTGNMSTASALRHAMHNLVLKRWRTLLVSFGASIGICGIALMLALGLGLEAKIKKEVEPLLDPGVLRLSAEADEYKPLDRDTMAKVREVPGVKDVFYQYAFRAGIMRDSKNTTDVVYSAKPESSLSKTDKSRLIAGTYPKTDRDIVLTESLAETLLAEGETVQDLVGKPVTVYFSNGGEFASKTEQHEMIVSGIIRNALFGLEGSSKIQYEFAEKLSASLDVEGVPRPSGAVLAVVDNEKNIQQVKQALEQLNTHPTTAEDIFRTITNYFRLIQGILGTFAGISLIVSSIMIGIVMYVNVLERVKEIGLLRALGARRKDIRRIFLTEAGTLGFWGGLLGIGGAFLWGFVGNEVLKQTLLKELPPFNAFIFPVGMIAFCIALSVALSVLAGWLPSAKASRLDPVEALRYE